MNPKPETHAQPIGILGGTFDPIHYGHLRTTDEVRRALGLREVRLVPAPRPPHRGVPQASAEQRLRMVELAVADWPGFRVDDREFHRAGPSYTVLTLESLRAELGATPLCLLMGVDAFHEIETWHQWQQLPELAHLVVMTRPPFSDADRAPAWATLRVTSVPTDLAQTPAGRILFQAVVPQDISATRIRAAIAAGEDVSNALPSAVWKFIQSHQLYRRVSN